ncbi:MAG: hypothetical protein Q9209_002669 [Squamulea sp. 1 TL-2023]
MRDDCWCRNETHIAWNRHIQLHSKNIPGTVPTLDQWCIDRSVDGHGECLDWHTKQYTICASHHGIALDKHEKRNDYCYKNHGNSRGIVPHYSKGPDTLTYNGAQRKMAVNGAVELTIKDNTKYCEPICRDYRGWDLPVMLAMGGKHGSVQSRHQIFKDVKDFPFKDGNDGQWPVLPSTRYHPGGISTTGAGVIDYWETDTCPHLKPKKKCPEDADGDPSIGH